MEKMDKVEKSDQIWQNGQSWIKDKIRKKITKFEKKNYKIKNGKIDKIELRKRTKFEKN